MEFENKLNDIEKIKFRDGYIKASMNWKNSKYKLAIRNLEEERIERNDWKYEDLWEKKKKRQKRLK